MAFVTQHVTRVVDLASRARARGMRLDSLVVLLLNTRGRVGAALAWSTATKGDVCIYAVSLETAAQMMAKIDPTITDSIIDPPAPGFVRVVVANEDTVAVTHVSVPHRPLGVA
jgi:hypothetical protein